MLVTAVGDETCWWHIQDIGDKLGYENPKDVTKIFIPSPSSKLFKFANIILAIFQVWNNVKGVTVEFIESEYDKVIYQAFIKPRNK